MDTLEFFNRVIPGNGIKFLAEWNDRPNHPRGGFFAHYPFVDMDDMADAALAMDAKGKTVYHACASFKEIIYKTKNDFEFVAGREQTNAKQAKAFWLDLDVGKANESNSYATREAALHDLDRLMKEVCLPPPLLVSSGNGLHAYWTFTQAIDRDDWTHLTGRLRSVLRHLKIKFDPSRDCDIASILRPPGTHNRKAGSSKLVKVMLPGRDRPAEEYSEILDIFIRANGVLVEAARSLVDNSDLGVTVEYPPSSFVAATEHCAQLKSFTEDGGANEPTWYACLSIAKHSIEGAAVGHQYSERHADYDYNNTQAKMDQWTFGPATCDKFRSVNAAGCEGCPHSVKSPIQLGYAATAPAPVLEPAPIVEASEALPQETGRVADVPAAPQALNTLPEDFPANVRWTNGVMTMSVEVDGVVAWVAFASPIFWPIARVRTEDGTYALRMKMQVKPGVYREFDLPTKTVSDPRGLAQVLGQYEIYIVNPKLAVTYVMTYATKIRQTADEINTYIQLGWQHDYRAFLIGEYLITPTDIVKVRVSEKSIPNTALRTSSFRLKGTTEEWAQGVNTLYNRKGGEPYQYAVCTGFGSVLAPLLEASMWCGIPLALTDGQGGKGKSTVCMIANSIYTNPIHTFIGATTPMAVPLRASQMCNLPLLIDEVTDIFNKSPEELGTILYAMSNGQRKVGSQSDGMERKSLPPWKLMSLMTGNKNILFQLAEARDKPEATQMRVLELDLDSTTCGFLDTMKNGSAEHAAHQQLATHMTTNVSGVVGVEYLRYIMGHLDEVREDLDRYATKILGTLGTAAARERFYAYHMACALVGGRIAKKLGFIDFDLTHLGHWIIKYVVNLRDVAREINTSIDDRFTAMLGDMHGQIIITRHFDTLSVSRGKTEMPLRPLRGSPVARLVLHSDTERGKLFISTAAIATWCRANRINHLQFRKELYDAGYIRAVTGMRQMDKPMSLSKGVPEIPLGKSRCLEFDYPKAQGYIDEYLGDTAKVVNLRQEKETEGVEAVRSKKKCPA